MNVSKKIGFILAGMMVGGLASIGHATEDQSLILEPSTSWRLDFGDERCSLIRSFGAGDDAVLLEIDSYGSNDGFPNLRVLLAGKPIPASIKPAGDVRFAFSNDDVLRTSSALMGNANGLSAMSFNMAFMPNPKSFAEKLNAGRDPRTSIDLKQYKDKVSEIGSEFAGRIDAVTLH